MKKNNCPWQVIKQYITIFTAQTAAFEIIQQAQQRTLTLHRFPRLTALMPDTAIVEK